MYDNFRNPLRRTRGGKLFLPSIVLIHTIIYGIVVRAGGIVAVGKVSTQAQGSIMNLKKGAP